MKPANIPVFISSSVCPTLSFGAIQPKVTIIDVREKLIYKVQNISLTKFGNVTPYSSSVKAGFLISKN